ncbi:MAG: DNA-processing protein DprA [Oscillospiraceae bacterium]|nr:DNA-processing protein DprA [Oscillospiraceae bacterium]
MSNLKYWLWLTGRKGLAGQAGMRVLAHFGSPEQAFFSDEGEYRMIPGVSDAACRSLCDKSLAEADRILGDCDRLGIRAVTMQDSVYPERLAAIHQPPMVLYMKGKAVNFDEEAAVAIVGTRDATPYGEWCAGMLSTQLVRSGALIVSGMAEGIDAAAVRGALRAGGRIACVLGGGIDVVYPRKHRELYEDVAAAGVLISEYPPGTEHMGRHFPVRNRIISGLSVGVIAVESRAFGGTMHTVGHALEQDRELFAVPGPIGAPTSEGTNRLIQEGAAKLILNADDVVCELIDRFPNRLRRKALPPLEQDVPRPAETGEGQTSSTVPVETPREKEVDRQPQVEYIDWQECKTKLTDDQFAVLAALGEKAMRSDDLIEASQIPARRVLSALTILQVQGYVAQEKGNLFRAAVRLKME